MLLASSSFTAIAEEGKFSPHTFGIQAAGGSAEYKGSSEDGDGVAHVYTYYNYAFSSDYSVETGITAGTDADDWKCTEVNGNEWVCRSDNRPIFDLQADKLEYSTIVMALKAKYQLSKRNSLYAKVGGQFYDYEFSRNNARVADKSGFGALIEGGWEIRWSSGWGLNAAYQYSDMGDLEVTSFNVGTSYSF